ncbi:hypothetical protein SEUCBS139899_009744 [Sporothrix eucalyptigena]
MLLPGPGILGGAAAFTALMPILGEAAKPPPPARLSFSPGYRGVDRCPQRCSLAGPHPGNWSLLRNLEQTNSCSETLFMGFSLYDGVDDASTYHRIFACTSFGADWTNTDAPRVDDEAGPGRSESPATDVLYQLGWDEESSGSGFGSSAGVMLGSRIATADIRSMSRQLRAYLSGGFRPANESVVLFAKSNQGTLGVYIGRGLDNAQTGEPALRLLEGALQQHNASSRVSVQLCREGTGDRDHVFGVMVASDGTFGAVQQALQTWNNGSCLPSLANRTHNYASTAVYLTTPVASDMSNSSIAYTNATYANTTSTARTERALLRVVRPRNTCRTIEVVDQDTCAKLAVRCGISGYDFTQYNSDPKLCSTLYAGMHVCCSAGERPSFRPSRNSDGTCAAHTVGHGETCAVLAASFDLSVDEINRFNARTWGFNGCNNGLYYQAIICLSDGDPPMPAPVDGAQCGPIKPGTPRQAANVDLNTVNPCPINACCDIWGSCGTTAEYCTDTHISSAPGSAAPNTAGCISNCGIDIVQSAAPAQFRSVGYYEGYQFDRPCLFQDPKQIDISRYTHIHYAFATILANYSLSTGDYLATYAFRGFQSLTGVQRIVSFGGWGFSTSPNTYDIFRQGVKAGNREALAANIAQFVTQHDLDGVDFDWEYPGAYDIPGIPPPVDGVDEGPNYLAFLQLVRQKLPGKSISIAVSSSYWYLRNFPIADMARVVDYVVYMTYDLHGQWDASTKWSQTGCGDGMCLRSHVNLTETLSALAMVTKAGVPSNKVVVGVSNYGRSFNMVDGGCWTEQCRYTGTATQSDAKPGVCTGVGGYIADAEIKQILANAGRVRRSYLDAGSDSNILVYDSNQWVSYMDSGVRARRTQRYRDLHMGGTAAWAIDLEDYTDAAPYGNAGGGTSTPWDRFILGIKTYGPAYVDTHPWERHGNWVNITCDSEPVAQLTCWTPQQRWAMLDAADAWTDAQEGWNTTYSNRPGAFTQHIADVFHQAENARCDKLVSSNCGTSVVCSAGPGYGAAGYEVWNSLINIHEVFKDFYSSLMVGTALTVQSTMHAFEDTFAPVRPTESTGWVDILMAVVSLGLTAVAAPFFNTFFSSLSYFTDHAELLDNVKDVTYAAIASGAIISGTIMKDSTPGSYESWTPQAQARFSDYMLQSIAAWGNATAYTLDTLMSGSVDSISRLTEIISNGKMITGAEKAGQPCQQGGLQTLNYNKDAASDAAQKATTQLIFLSAIPDLWHISGQRPFVLDTGFPCNTADPLPDYMSADTMHATYGCYQDRLYYLVMPKGAATHCGQDLCNLGTCSPNTCKHSFFVPPTGLDSLTGGSAWGGLTRQDLITGSVRTYLQNSGQNTGGPADPNNRNTINDLLNEDLTTPGIVRIPVCSADVAYKAWERGMSVDTPHYPCSLPPKTTSDCGDSTFVDQTSSASPSVSDCMLLVNDIEGIDHSYMIFADQQAILSNHTCVFGVQGKSGGTRISNQDVVDLVRDSISKFGGSGKVGAKGSMVCGGDTVEWGIY